MSAQDVIKRLRERGLLAIVEHHAEANHVAVSDVCSPKRHSKGAAAARRAAWRELRATTVLSYPEIGALFGRDHSTIMSACKSVAKAPMPPHARAVLAQIRVI